MKTIYILLIAAILLSSACQQSQFPKTTRQYRNGTVTYVNHFGSEWVRSSTVKSRISHPKETETHKKLFALIGTVKQDNPQSEIAKISPASFSFKENLIASTSIDPAYILVNNKRVVPGNDRILLHKKQVEVKCLSSKPDTIKNTLPKKGKEKVYFAKIKFKNGQEETVKIIYRTPDTLKYQSILEKDVVRTVLMEQVESILPDARKTEKLGLAGFILSILGLVPIFGLPFAVIGVILGVRSLRKIKRYPEKFKGKGFGTMSVIFGILGMIVSFILIFYGVFSFLFSFHQMTLHM